jgi:hypothetical protein
VVHAADGAARLRFEEVAAGERLLAALDNPAAGLRAA